RAPHRPAVRLGAVGQGTRRGGRAPGVARWRPAGAVSRSQSACARAWRGTGPLAGVAVTVPPGLGTATAGRAAPAGHVLGRQPAAACAVRAAAGVGGLPAIPAATPTGSVRGWRRAR